MRAICFLFALAALVSTNPIAAAQASDPRAQIDAYARSFIGTGTAPSVSIAITRDGQVVYAKSFGDRSLDPKLPARTNTVYDGASLMKQFTAAALALLATQGKIDLDAPLSRYLPQIPHSSEVTIAQLYGMTSGYQDTGEGSEDASIPLATRITRVAARPLLFQPGTRYNYSNTNYELLGLLVERVSGMPYATFMRTSGMRGEALAWLQRALHGREAAADFGGDFAAMGRKYGAPQHFTPLGVDDRGTVQLAVFSLKLTGKPYTYVYDGTKKAGLSLLPVWNP